MSLDPDSPPTVEKRIVTGAFLPFCMRSAQQMSLTSSVVSQTPCAPAPLAWTTWQQRISGGMMRTRISPHTLRDALPVVVGNRVDQVKVLQQERAVLAGSLVRGWILVGHADAVGVGAAKAKAGGALEVRGVHGV